MSRAAFRIFQVVSSVAVATITSMDSVVAQADSRTLVVTVDATSETDFGMVDLATGQLVTSQDAAGGADWDIGIRRFEIRLGSRTGSAGAALVVNNAAESNSTLLSYTAENQLERFNSITAAAIPTEDVVTTASAGRNALGWLRGPIPGSIDAADAPPFVYGLDEDHRLSPTFNIYLVKNGTAVYKVQFLSYYHPTSGAARFITFRYARLPTS